MASKHTPFFTEGDNVNQWYRAARANPAYASYLAELWTRFEPVCGDDPKDFLTDVRGAKGSFHQRVWEMRLACLLMDWRLNVVAPPPGAPDLALNEDDARVWVEAYVPNNDKRNPTSAVVLETLANGCQRVEVATNEITLRLTGAVSSKHTQHGNRTKRENPNVLTQHPYVVAINGCLLEHSDISGFDTPDIVKALLLANGKPLSKSDGIGGAKLIDVGGFTDDRFTGISAILFSPVLPPFQTDGGGHEMHVVHNPKATALLRRGTFCFGKEWWLDERGELQHEVRSTDDG